MERREEIQWEEGAVVQYECLACSHNCQDPMPAATIVKTQCLSRHAVHDHQLHKQASRGCIINFTEAKDNLTLNLTNPDTKEVTYIDHSIPSTVDPAAP